MKQFRPVENFANMWLSWKFCFVDSFSAIKFVDFSRVKMPGFATDSESEDDYVNGVVPERRAVVNLKGGIRRDNLETGVDFEIEDLENFENQEAPLDEPDDEYLSVGWLVGFRFQSS